MISTRKSSSCSDAQMHEMHSPMGWQCISYVGLLHNVSLKSANVATVLRNKPNHAVDMQPTISLCNNSVKIWNVPIVRHVLRTCARLLQKGRYFNGAGKYSFSDREIGKVSDWVSKDVGGTLQNRGWNIIVERNRGKWNVRFSLLWPLWSTIRPVALVLLPVTPTMWPGIEAIANFNHRPLYCTYSRCSTKPM